MRAVAVAALVLVSTAAFADSKGDRYEREKWKGRGNRGPALIWVDAPLYSWGDDQRDELDRKLGRADYLVSDLNEQLRNNRQADRALRDAAEAIDQVRDALADARGRSQMIPADDRERSPKLLGAKSRDLVVLSVREIDKNLLDADTALASIDGRALRDYRVGQTINEARTMLREVHADLLRTVGRSDPTPLPPVVTLPAPNPGNGYPPPPPTAQLPPPMNPQQRQMFFRVLDRETTGQDRLRIVEEAAVRSYFTVADVTDIMSRFARPAMRLRAVYAVHSKIVDPENQTALYASFSSGRDKEELRRVLALPPSQTRFTLDAVAQTEFNLVLNRVQTAYTDEDALAELSTAADGYWFRCDQVASLMATFSSSMLKLKAIDVIAPRVIDPENYAVVQARFPMANDKLAVRDALLSR